MKGFIFGFLAISLAALVGCQADAGVAKVSNSEQFAKLCQKAPTVHFAFLAIAAILDQSNSNVKKVVDAEGTAYQIISNTCAHPPQDIVEALTTVQEAYITMLSHQKTVVDAQPKA